MFKKVLIAEDHEIQNLSLQRTLLDLNIPLVDFANYCDDALARVSKSLRDNSPYDLMITDLHFDTDHRQQKLKDGKNLVSAIRAVLPSIKVIVFSAEQKSGIIDALFKDNGINAYVRKGRNDGKELKKAIDAVLIGKNFLAHDIKNEVKKLNSYEFTSYDIALVSLLSKGVIQKNIPTYLVTNDIKPNSLSSVEKRLNVLKEELRINNNEQLIAFCKDLGVI